MTREKILEQILKLISSGELPKDLYDKYLSDTPIGFMSFNELEKYFDCNKPTEQEIFKKFEDLGYEILDNNLYLVILKNDKQFIIGKKLKSYFVSTWNNEHTKYSITFQEHQLLHELFKCWGWI